MSYRFAFDIGGTFTDLVLLSSDGSVKTAKVLTGAPDVVAPICSGLLAMLNEHDIEMSEINEVVVGATTAVTNLVIEKKGAKTGIITTAGFRDVIEIARELRYDLYDLTTLGPDPIVPRELRYEINERVDASGEVIQAASDEEIELVIRQLVNDGVRAIAVCFLHSFTNPSHEDRVKVIANKIAPQLYVSLSYQVLGEIREFVYTSLGGGEKVVRLTGLESQAVAQVELPLWEASRSGRMFGGGCQIIANGIAPVSAIPTTTATLALFNAEPAGGRSLVINRLGFALGSGTAAAGATLFVSVSPGPLATAPTAMATGYAVQSLNGSSRASRALWATAQTFPSSPSNGWMGVISTFQLAAANVGQGDGFADLDGLIVVPPRYAMGIAILSGAGTSPLYAVSASWAEFEGQIAG